MAIVSHVKLWAHIKAIKPEITLDEFFAKLIPHPFDLFKLLYEKSYEKIWAKIQIRDKIGVTNPN